MTYDNYFSFNIHHSTLKNTFQFLLYFAFVSIGHLISTVISLKGFYVSYETFYNWLETLANFIFDI